MCNCFQEKTVNEIKARQFRKKKKKLKPGKPMKLEQKADQSHAPIWLQQRLQQSLILASLLLNLFSNSRYLLGFLTNIFAENNIVCSMKIVRKYKTT
jgi:hypothetical protein